MKNSIQNICKTFGIEIHRVDGRNSLIGALRNLKDRGLKPALIVDGGAAHGSWTRDAQKIFPQAQYVAVEPLSEHYPALEVLPHTTVIKGALAGTRGITILHVHNEYNSSITSENPSTDQREVPTFTLDEVTGGASNVLVKLDLEGAELGVLRAASLEGVVGLILECSFLSYFQDHVLLSEICSFMKEKGFIPHDLFNMSYDPKTGMLMQADIVFLPEKSPLREVKF